MTVPINQISRDCRKVHQKEILTQLPMFVSQTLDEKTKAYFLATDGHIPIKKKGRYLEELFLYYLRICTILLLIPMRFSDST